MFTRYAPTAYGSPIDRFLDNTQAVVGMVPPVAAKQRTHLSLVHGDQTGPGKIGRQMATAVRERGEEIQFSFVRDRSYNVLRYHLWRLPTLVISWQPLTRLKPPRGAILEGAKLGLDELWRILQQRGVAVADGQQLHCREPFESLLNTAHGPDCYRVASLFREPLWSCQFKISAATLRQQPVAELQRSGFCTADAADHQNARLYNEPAILELARKCHQALARLPYLEIDIVRDARSGVLYVVSVATARNMWKMFCPESEPAGSHYRLNLVQQFNALNTIPRLLVNQTRKFAC